MLYLQLHYYREEFDNQPLMTSSMRKAKLESTYGGYEKVVIRVQFHDKLVLQGLFRPRETGAFYMDSFVLKIPYCIELVDVKFEVFVSKYFVNTKLIITN